MSDPLSGLLHALDRLPPGPAVSCFIRDDDAGWDDARQLALVDATLAAGVPMDLAAIPTTLGPALVRELKSRIDTAPTLLGVHQHGHSHTNHQTQGRKCEFGSQRGAAQQRHDLLDGRQRLRDAFGPRLAPLFTPPWNRCSAHTPMLLAELGFAALSRDRGARDQQAQGALPELAVDVDWCRQVREGGVATAAAELMRATADCHASGQPMGLMLHHAAMTQDEFDLLRVWLRALGTHPRLAWHPMVRLAGRSLSPAAEAAAAG